MVAKVLVVAVPKQQHDPVLGQLRKETGIPADRGFQATSPHLSITGLPGQAELAEQPTLPEQALPTVARLIEALEKKGTGGHLRGVCGCTGMIPHSARVWRCPESQTSPHTPRYLCSVGRVRELGGLSPCPLPLHWRKDLGFGTDPSLLAAPQVSTARGSTDLPLGCWGMLS